MSPIEKLKQLMAKLVELPPTTDKLDKAFDYCSGGEFHSVQDIASAIVADMESSSSPNDFLLTYCGIDLDNDDVGSIMGKDASNGPILNREDVISEIGGVSSLTIPPHIEEICGLTVTYPSYNSLNASGQFIMKCVSKWWLKGAFDIVDEAYGLKFDENSFVTYMSINLDDIQPSGGAIVLAYVNSYFNLITHNTTILECYINTNLEAYGNMDLTNPNGVAFSIAGSKEYLDRTLAHELVHAVMSANISGFDLLPSFFREGTAELIAGADDSRKNQLLTSAGSVSTFLNGLSENPTSNLLWYTSGYILLRWYIKRTSDPSISVTLPEIEVYEYKVSDGVAFEYGKANYFRMDLVSEELVDFFTRQHNGLNNWDLCTSPEYLESKYGSTIRIPFDDAVFCEDIAYSAFKSYIVPMSAIFMPTVPSTINPGLVTFMFNVPNRIDVCAFGPPIPTTDSLYFIDACRYLFSHYACKFYYTVGTQTQAWNSSRFGFSMASNSVSDTTLSGFASRRILYLVGATSLWTEFSPTSYTVSDLIIALDNLYSDCTAYGIYIDIYDFSIYNMLDIINNTATNADYVSALTDVSSDMLSIIYHIETNLSDHIQYHDCRRMLLSAFPTLLEFNNKAICYEIDTNIIWGDYPNSEGPWFTEEFADVMWKCFSIIVGTSNNSSSLDVYQSDPVIRDTSKVYTYNTNSPCYYVSLTQLPFSSMLDSKCKIDVHAIDGISGDVLSVNLHTVYDPLSPSYYQGGGTCKSIYDFKVDKETNKTLTGLINYHDEGDNVPNVDNNYSYPAYGTGCPWIIYPDDIKDDYDVIYFYFTRDNYSGTITYQLSSNEKSEIKDVFQTVIFGSPDTDNYTSKYPLYVGGGVVPIISMRYSYKYQPPGDPPPDPKIVVVDGNAYNFDLLSPISCNTSPLYPINPFGSQISNFSFRGADGEWKYLALFSGNDAKHPVDTRPCLYTLADNEYWGAILPYAGSDFSYSYIYNINGDEIKPYKPVRILNPYRDLKEERGLGAIKLPNLYAVYSDNIYGLRTFKSSNYESKSIFDIAYMQSIATSSIPVMSIVGTYTAYGGDTTFDGIGQSSIVLTDPYDEFDKIDIIFTEDSGTNRYVATWHKHALVSAIENSRDIDFDLTRGVVHYLNWNINISGCTKKVLWGLGQNCGIIDIIGYKRKVSRYLVVPNGYYGRDFNMFMYSENKDGLSYNEQLDIYNKVISEYKLSNDLYIYIGEG